MPRVRQTDAVAEAVEGGAGLEMRDVDDEDPARREDPGELVREGAVVRDVLQVVDDDHLVERAIGERRPGPVELIHLAPHQLPDRSHRAGIEIGASPLAAAPPQQVADDAVVGADVQVPAAGRIVDQRFDLPELGLLEHRLAVEGQGPVGGGRQTHPRRR